MTVFECKGDMILDDAGLMFPDDNHPGVDLILPDYTLRAGKRRQAARHRHHAWA